MAPSALAGVARLQGRRPNILLAISDDQSWAHTGAAGCKTVNTPAFDRVAREGVLFANAFAAAPQCSPNRASLLTGRHIWQNEEAGTHASNFPRKFPVYTDLLEASGYVLGYTGKPWGPGNWEITGWPRNPAGPEFNKINMKEKIPQGIRKTDYAANFKAFLDSQPKDKPFCFWYGCKEPHREYEQGVGLRAGKKIEDVVVPPFLPDTPEIRSDILDYCFEIDWFDRHLVRMLRMLEEAGELDNTIVVVTSDNGMPFPRAKANLYEYGTHMPLAIRWPARVKAGRVIEDLTSFVDFAPTFLEAAGLTPPPTMTGRSFLDILASGKSGRVDPTRDKVFTGRERHTHARPDNLGYPARAIRTHDYLYILNLKPDRWPAGDPEGFFDIDGSPSKTYMLENRTSAEGKRLFALAVAKRPAEELYDIKADPGCVNNLAALAKYAAIQKKLRAELEQALTEQKDPRVLGYGDVFDSYPRYSAMRDYPGFKKQGEYNPKFQVKPPLPR
ncbi:heparan N-sulfatase [candidate division BRC1 bacterium SM23_51]|nr:MAG: heparan N-sulfatase [candidate division BRC1 bacterium SM23_51]